MASKTTIVDWLNENSIRDYPFVANTNMLTDSAIAISRGIVVDAQLRTPTDTGVALVSILADATTVLFTLSTTETFLASRETDEYQNIRNTSGNLLTIQQATTVPIGLHTFVEPPKFEFATLTVWNTPWNGVSQVAADSVNVGSDKLHIIDGFNVLSKGVGTDLLEFNAISNAGRAMYCGMDGIESEVDCTEFVGSINGAFANNSGVLSLFAGARMVVIDDPDNHRIFLGLRLKTQDIC